MMRENHIKLPDELKKTTQKKLLHIGDTYSVTYPYYKQLIQDLKPDIIVHTGDTADEVKVGRIPETKEEYLTKVQVLLDILKESGSKVYWIPGNNDLPEEIAKRAPFIEVVQPDTVLELEGIKICVTHSKEQITQNASVYLYGHGRRAENGRVEQKSAGNQALCLNSLWNVYVCTLPEFRVYELERPEYSYHIW